jgi:hypothetical protein
LIAAPFFFEKVFFKLAEVLDLFPIKSLGHSSTGRNFSNPNCLNDKKFFSANCFRTWRQVLQEDVILDKKIIEKDLKKAIHKLKGCLNKSM